MSSWQRCFSRNMVYVYLPTCWRHTCSVLTYGIHYHSIRKQFNLFLLQCSVSCGLGSQSRQLICVSKEPGANPNTAVDTRLCEHMGKPKVLLLQNCQLQDSCPQWKSERWSEVCSFSISNHIPPIKVATQYDNFPTASISFFNLPFLRVRNNFLSKIIRVSVKPQRHTTG